VTSYAKQLGIQTPSLKELALLCCRTEGCGSGQQPKQPTHPTNKQGKQHRAASSVSVEPNGTVATKRGRSGTTAVKPSSALPDKGLGNGKRGLDHTWRRMINAQFWSAASILGRNASAASRSATAKSSIPALPKATLLLKNATALKITPTHQVSECTTRCLAA